MNLIDVIVKDDKENLPKLREYFNMVARIRANQSSAWNEFASTFILA